MSSSTKPRKKRVNLPNAFENQSHLEKLPLDLYVHEVLPLLETKDMYALRQSCKTISAVVTMILFRYMKIQFWAGRGPIKDRMEKFFTTMSVPCLEAQGLTLRIDKNSTNTAAKRTAILVAFSPDEISRFFKFMPNLKAATLSVQSGKYFRTIAPKVLTALVEMFSPATNEMSRVSTFCLQDVTKDLFQYELSVTEKITMQQAIQGFRNIKLSIAYSAVTNPFCSCLDSLTRQHFFRKQDGLNNLLDLLQTIGESQKLETVHLMYPGYIASRDYMVVGNYGAYRAHGISGQLDCDCNKSFPRFKQLREVHLGDLSIDSRYTESFIKVLSSLPASVRKLVLFDTTLRDDRQELNLDRPLPPTIMAPTPTTWITICKSVRMNRKRKYSLEAVSFINVRRIGMDHHGEDDQIHPSWGTWGILKDEELEECKQILLNDHKASVEFDETGLGLYA